MTVRCVFGLALPTLLFAVAVVAQDAAHPIIDVHMHPFGVTLTPEGNPAPIICVNDPADCDNPVSAYTTDDAYPRPHPHVYPFELLTMGGF